MYEYKRQQRVYWAWYIVGRLIRLAIICSVFAGIVYGLYRMNRYGCHSRYAQYNPEYVGFITGCMITADEQRVPADSLRLTM